MNKNYLLRSISAVAIIISAAACVPESDTSIYNAQNIEYKEAQSQQYANAIEQYSLISVDVLTSSPEWQNGVFAFEGASSLIDEATFGAIASNTADIESGFCVSTSGNQFSGKVVTWFNSQDADNFVLKGLGEQSQALITANLAKRLPERTFGSIEAAAEVRLFGGGIEALPLGCDVFNIPIGAPVVITEVDVPSLPDDAVTRTEYTTVACEPGKVGHYLLSLDVTHLSDGKRIVAGQVLQENDPLPQASHIQSETAWNVQQANCQDEISVSSISSNSMNVTGVQLSMASSNAIGANIKNNLENIQCKQATQENVDEDQNDFPNDDMTSAGEYELQQYNTCSDSVAIQGIQNVGDVRLSLLRTETHTTPCGGSPGTDTDAVSGFSGTITHDAWVGEASYSRDVYLQETTNIINASINREERERWEGVNIECERTEDLQIPCNTAYTSMTSYEITDDRGLNYRRTNTIDGWANAGNLTPNPPENPTWNFQSSSSGCQWREEQTTGGCLTITEERFSSIDALNQTISWSDWSEVSVTNNCANDSNGNSGESYGGGYVDTDGDGIGDTAASDMTGSGQYPSSDTLGGSTNGYTSINDWGHISGTHENGDTGRVDDTSGYYTYNDNGDGSTSGASGVCNSGCSGLAGGLYVAFFGDGSYTSWICFLRDTQVIMSDGTHKSIQDIRVGDKTLTGRVIDTIAHTFPYAPEIKNGDTHGTRDVHLYNGVEVTGNHVVLEEKRWIPVGQSKLAVPHFVRGNLVFYNMYVENGLIPIKSDDGNIQYFADSRNNENGEAEIGFAKMLTLSKSA